MVSWLQFVQTVRISWECFYQLTLKLVYLISNQFEAHVPFSLDDIWLPELITFHIYHHFSLSTRFLKVFQSFILLKICQYSLNTMSGDVQVHGDFIITSFLMSIDIGAIFMIIQYWILNLNKVNYFVITRKYVFTY